MTIVVLVFCHLVLYGNELFRVLLYRFCHSLNGRSGPCYIILDNCSGRSLISPVLDYSLEEVERYNVERAGQVCDGHLHEYLRPERGARKVSAT